MSAIVYTTVIKQETINAYIQYQNAKLKLPSGDVSINQLWIKFCNACEKENKKPLSVVEQLKK